MEHRVEGALHDFDRRLDHRNRTEIVDLLDATKSQSKGVTEMRNTMSEIFTQLEAVWQIQSGERAGKILTWISSIANEDHHAVAREGRVSGTGDWIFEREVYKTWSLSEDSLILWLHGIPGAGKTKLMSRVVDELLSTSNHGERIAYFYCNQADDSRRKANSVLSSFIKQLGHSYHGRIHISIVQIYELKEKSGFTSNSLSRLAILSILKDVANHKGNTILLLDALDECYTEERATIIDACNWLIEEVPRLKILISSRRNDDIKRQLMRNANLGIAAGDDNNDIARFVIETITWDDERRHKLGLKAIPNDLVSQIVAEITGKGGDMFQWAALQVAQLLQLERTSDIRSNLGKLPVGLKETYDGIIGTVRAQAGSKPVVAMRTFSWLLAISTTVDIDTLLAAVCQDPDDNRLFPVDIDKDYVLGACQNLITTHSTSHTEEYWEFSHLSVQEYLENLEDENFNLQHSLQMIFHVSMNTLHSICQGPVLPTCQALYEFAAETWCEQAQISAQYINSNEKALARLKDFMGSPRTPSAAWVAWHECAKVQEYPRLNRKPAFYACVLGLSNLVQAWIDKQELDSNDIDDDGVLLLSYAIVWDQTEIVDMLLKHGADINLKGQPIWAALWLAQKKGSLAILEKLLKNGANIEAEYDETFSICHDFRGVRRLFCNVRINLVDGALLPRWVPHKDYDIERAVALLVAHGADYNAVLPKGSPHRTLLQNVLFIPMDEDRKPLVDLLLRHGAKFEDPWADDVNNTALIEAVLTRDEFVVEYLIQYGVEVNASTTSSYDPNSGFYPNALLAAMMEDNLGIVQLLLQTGARADAGISLADAAVVLCSFGKLEYIEVALDTAITTDINALTDRHDPVNTPLLAAVQCGRSELVRLFLKRGANVNQLVPGSKHGSPLLTAIGCSHLDMVSLLLDRGARLDVSGEGIPYPLAYAIEQSQFDVYRLLVNHDIGEQPLTNLGVDAALKCLFKFKVTKTQHWEDIDSVLHPLLHVATLDYEVDRWLENFFKSSGSTWEGVDHLMSWVTKNSSSQPRITVRREQEFRSKWKGQNVEYEGKRKELNDGESIEEDSDTEGDSDA